MIEVDSGLPRRRSETIQRKKTLRLHLRSLGRRIPLSSIVIKKTGDIRSRICTVALFKKHR